MFIGRQREMALLKKRYESEKFEFIGIYGRRRVGKTALISEFTRHLHVGWCTAIEDDLSANLKRLSQAVYALSNPNGDADLAPVFPDFHSAIEAAFEAARTDRVVLVIDEYPYLANAYPSISSVLQAAIDAHHEDSHLYLILCGSSLSFMKEQLLNRKSPLYGRRTAQIELKPFNFFESCEFFPNFDATTMAQVYGMVGGIPLYLLQFDEHLDLEQNIAEVFLDPGSILYEEPSNLLNQEVNKPATYNAILSALAKGATQHNEIASKSGLEASALDYYIKELVRIGLVQRETPVQNRNKRKSLWHLTDPLFAFWYRFIRPRQSLIERGLGSNVSTRIIENLSAFMGPVFEEICRQWLWRELAANRLEFEMTSVGRWWGNDPKARSEAEIDIVALDDSSTVLVGECKWRNELTDAGELEKLDERAYLAGANSATPRWLFSRSGFTSGCIDAAREMRNARLITFEDMMKTT